MPEQADTRTLEAAIAYCAARRQRDAAVKRLRDYWEEHGECGDEHPDPCFRRTRMGKLLPEEEWCSVCQGSQSIWSARQKAGTAVATTLKKLMKLTEGSQCQSKLSNR